MHRLTKLPLSVAFALVLLGCSQAPPAQYLLDTPSSALRVRSVVGSIEVGDISLPRYASGDELSLQQEDGSLLSDPNRVWADDSDRGATLSLVRNLGAITGARVATEPWPFATPPDAAVRVTVEQFFAASNGTLRLEGSYAIAPVVSNISDRGGRFDISVPLPDTEPASLARAHGLALQQMAEIIAKRIGR